MVNKVEKWKTQKLRSELIQSELLVERLRGRLCGGNHDWVEMESHYIYSTGIGGPGTEVNVAYTKVCNKCELMVRGTE